MYVQYIYDKGVKQMSESGLFSIKDFAKYSRSTRDTLLHYDRIGLLSPVSRGENNYRYYSSAQLAVMNVIRTCQQLGMTLDEIKEIIGRRTPDMIHEVFLQQIDRIDKRIEEWNRARKLLFTLQASIHSVSDIDEGVISIQFLPPEAIILGDLNDYSRGRTYFDAMLSFYQSISEKYPDQDLNYHVWGTISEERVNRRDWVGADRFYFHNPEGHDRRPAGLYAVGYMRCGYSDGSPLYQRMLEYIEKHNFKVCGPAFEEYPLNEVCEVKEQNYLLRLLMTVCERS